MKVLDVVRKGGKRSRYALLGRPEEQFWPRTDKINSHFHELVTVQPASHYRLFALKTTVYILAVVSLIVILLWAD